jgi:hypothetical protein
MHDTSCSRPVEIEVVKKKRRRKKNLWSTKKQLEQSKMSNGRRRFANLRGTTKDLDPQFERSFVPLPVVRRSRSVQIGDRILNQSITNNAQESVEIEDVFVEVNEDLETQVANFDMPFFLSLFDFKVFRSACTH